MTPGAVEGTAVSDTGAGLEATARGSGKAGHVHHLGATVAGWVSEYGDELERHLVGMLRRPEEARDVLQEVWVTALRSPPDDGPGSNVRAWLYRVATNGALDRLATDRRRRGLLEKRAPELEPDGEERPDELLRGLGPDARGRVREHVSRLPRKQRDAVWLRWIDGLEYEAIAERLECSPEAARANVYQGLKKLRSSLFDLWREVQA